MPSLTGNVTTAAETSHFRVDSGSAWTTIDCPFCDGSQARVVARVSANQIVWARCATCLWGFVKNEDVVSPSKRPFRVVQGLDPSTERAWDEVRSCLSVAATTAAVHICRKILLHVAVANGLSEKGSDGRSPSFYRCVEYLKEVGLVTPPMEPWVERIREVGNGAAHELETIVKEDALSVAQFTEQLLILTYEMSALMNAVAPLGREDPTA